MEEHPKAVRLAHSAAAVCAAFSALAGLSVAIAWFLGHPGATTFGLNFGRVSPGAALLVVISGGAILARALWPQGRITRWLVGLAALVTAFLAAGRLVNLLFASDGWSWGQWLGSAGLAEVERRLGSMVMLTAVMFLCIAAASCLAVVAGERRGLARRLEFAFASLVLPVCVLTAVSYVATTDRLLRGFWMPPAAPTALLCLPLGVALLALARPRAWLLRLVTCELGDTATQRFAWLLLGGTALLVAGALGSGAFYLKQSIRTAVLQTGRDLSVVAGLQARGITEWWNQLHDHAEAVRAISRLGEDVDAFLRTPDEGESQRRLAQWLTLLDAGERYERAALFEKTPDGARQRFALPPQTLVLDDPLRARLDAAFRANAVLVGDLELDPTTRRPRLDVLLPVTRPGARGDTPPDEAQAVIVLRLDPTVELYPELLTNWPAATRTAETLLVRQEAGLGVYLSPLRGATNAPLTLRLPLVQTHTNLEAAVAFRKGRGELQCHDYRGVPVRAAFRVLPVGGTAWHLIAKVDQEEIYRALRVRAVTVFAALGTLVLALVLAARLLWQHRNAESLQQQLAARREREALSQRFAHLMALANDVIMLSDDQLRILELNPRAADVYGYSLDELRRMRLPELRSPATRDTFDRDRIEFAQRASALFQTVHQRKDGSCFPVEINSRRVEIGGEWFWLGIVRDITERRHAEEALRRSEERLRYAMEGATDGLWDWNLATGEFYLSPRYSQMLGYAPGELPASRAQWDQLVHPEDRARLDAGLEECLANRAAALHCECRVRTQGGDWCWMLVRGKVVERDAGGRAVRFVGTHSDISARKRTEAALIASERGYRELFNATPEAIFVFDLESGWLLDVNESMLRMYGYESKEDALHCDPAEFNDGEPPYTEAEAHRRRQQALQAGPQVFEWRARRRNGDRFWAEVSLRATQLGGEGRVLAVVRNITERRQAALALADSERRFRSIVENVNDALYIHDFTGQILEVNDHACQMLGYDRAELIGASLHQVDGEANRPEARQRMEKLMQTGRVVFDGEHRHKDGSVIAVAVSASVVSREGHGLVQAFVRNITAQKRAEAERDRLIAILERTPDVVGIADLEGRSVYLNATGRRLVGDDVTPAGERKPVAAFHPAWAAERVLKEGLPTARAKGVWIGETALITRTGAELPMSQVILAHRDAGGQVTHFSSILRDLTERKRVEQIVRASEERLRTIIEHSTQLFYAHTPDHVLTYVSPQSREFMDCDPEEARVRWLEFLSDHPGNQIGLERTEAAIRTGQRQPPYELELVSRKGRKLWVEVRESPVVLHGGTVAIVGSLTNITQRKRSEQIVQRLTQLSRELGAAGDTAAAAHAVVEAAQDLLGWDACHLRIRSEDLQRAFHVLAMDTLNGRRVSVPSALNDELTPLERRVMNEGPQLILREAAAFENLRPFGNTSRPSASLLFVPLRHQGRYLGLFSIQSYQFHAYDRAALDLLQTLADQAAGALERLRAEAALRESEDRYRQLFEAESDAIVLVENETGRICEANAAAAALYGYSREELLTKLNTDLSADVEETRRVTRETPVVADQVIAIPLRRHRKRDGTVFPVEITGRFFTWRGQTMHIAAIRDITERKRAETALRESEEKYKSLIETTNTGYVTVDAEGRVMDANQEYVRLTGHERLDQILGRRVTEWTAPYDLERNAAAVRECLEQGFVRNFEVDYRSPNGAITPLEINATVLHAGGTVSIQTLCRDITKRRRSEQALRESEQKFRSIVQSAPLGLHMYSLADDGRLIFTGCNPAAERMLGARHDPLFGKDLVEAFPDLKGSEVPQRYHDAATAGIPWQTSLIEYADERIKGAFEVYAFQTAPGQMVAMFQEVTERKQAEERERRLAAENERLLKNLQLQFNALPIGCIVTLPDLTIMDWNPAAARIFGFPRADVVGHRPFGRIIPPADRMLAEQFIADLLGGNETRSLIMQNTTQDGRTITCEWHDTPLRDEAGRVVGVLAMVEDITERLRAEAALRETERRLSTLVANLPTGFAYRCRNDRDWTMEFITAGVETLTGHPPEQLTSGRVVFNDLIHPDDHDLVWNTIQTALDARQPYQIEYRVLHRNAEERWVLEQGCGVFNERGEVLALEGLVTDITVRKHAEATARDLSGRLLAAQDEERRYLARELHDTTAQTLAALSMNLTLLGARIPADNREAHQVLVDTVALGERAGQEIRTLSYLLHPPILEHAGLAGALREYAAGFQRRSGVQVNIEIGGEIGRFAPEAELALLRIVQESLGNVHRHSGSPTALIRLRARGGQLVLDIADQGSGFPTEADGSTEGQMGVGIAGMRERLHHLGGRLEIRSNAAGTIVRATLPLCDRPPSGNN